MEDKGLKKKLLTVGCTTGSNSQLMIAGCRFPIPYLSTSKTHITFPHEVVTG